MPPIFRFGGVLADAQRRLDQLRPKPLGVRRPKPQAKHLVVGRIQTEHAILLAVQPQLDTAPAGGHAAVAHLTDLCRACDPFMAAGQQAFMDSGLQVTGSKWLVEKNLIFCPGVVSLRQLAPSLRRQGVGDEVIGVRNPFGLRCAGQQIACPKGKTRFRQTQAPDGNFQRVFSGWTQNHIENKQRFDEGRQHAPGVPHAQHAGERAGQRHVANRRRGGDDQAQYHSFDHRRRPWGLKCDLALQLEQRVAGPEFGKFHRLRPSTQAPCRRCTGGRSVDGACMTSRASHIWASLCSWSKMWRYTI